MNILKLLSDLGIDVAILIAGLSGGLVSLRKDEDLSGWQKILTVVSGGLIATYITPVIIPLSIKIFGEGTKLEYGLGFVIGYMGLKSIEFVISLLTKTKTQKDESNSND